MKTTSPRFLYLLLLGFALSSKAFALPINEPVPGGVAIVPLGAYLEKPFVRYLKRKVMTIRDHGRWVAIVGIPLGAKPGTHFLKMKPANENPKTLSFTVTSTIATSAGKSMPGIVVSPAFISIPVCMVSLRRCFSPSDRFTPLSPISVS